MFSISREELFLGAPYKLGEICKIHQLTLGEICLGEGAIGMDKYNFYVGLLTMDIDDIKETLEKKGFPVEDSMFEDFSVFEYLILSATNDKGLFLELQKALSTFIKEDILISPKSKTIIVGEPQQRRVIKQEEFEELANALRAHNKMRIKQPPPENETEMQKRFRLKREMREKVKERQAKKGDGDGSEAEFADIMSSLCTMNIGINALNIKDYTIYQIKEQLERAQLREKYYTELDMIMAGADSKKIKPIHYVRNLLKEVN